jgi:hypothetical protein
MKTYLNNKVNEKNLHSYTPITKFLVIIACHCINEIKLKTIKNNLKYFLFDNFNIIVINSIDLEYNLELQEYCSQYDNVEYIETENFAMCDFGKWAHVLKTKDVSDKDFVVFTNDSYIIHDNINHFFNLSLEYNVQIYGYNDSLECRYHYQSYLFVLKKDAIPIFMDNFYKHEQRITCLQDVIYLYELDMTDWFDTKDVFLKIANITNGVNIFYRCKWLYNILKESKLLPFTKLKAIA